MRESERLRDEFRATNEVPAVLIGSRLRGLVDDAIAALERAEAERDELRERARRWELLHDDQQAIAARAIATLGSSEARVAELERQLAMCVEFDASLPVRRESRR